MASAAMAAAIAAEYALPAALFLYKSYEEIDTILSAIRTIKQWREDRVIQKTYKRIRDWEKSRGPPPIQRWIGNIKDRREERKQRKRPRLEMNLQNPTKEQVDEQIQTLSNAMAIPNTPEMRESQPTTYTAEWKPSEEANSALEAFVEQLTPNNS